MVAISDELKLEAVSDRLPVPPITRRPEEGVSWERPPPGGKRKGIGAGRR